MCPTTEGWGEVIVCNNLKHAMHAIYPYKFYNLEYPYKHHQIDILT